MDKKPGEGQDDYMRLARVDCFSAFCPPILLTGKLSQLHTLYSSFWNPAVNLDSVATCLAQDSGDSFVALPKGTIKD